MSRVSGPVSILTRDEMQRIHDGAVEILHTVGMRIEHPGARDYLRAFGCFVDHESEVVKFPPQVTEAAAEKMRRDHAGERGIEDRIPMRYTAMYFTTQPRRILADFDVNTGGFPPFILDLDRVRRPATLDDVRDSIRLADGLAHIGMAGLPCSAQDIPHQLRPVVMAAELVKHTAKIGGIEAWRPQDIDYLTELGVVVRGSRAELRRRPVLVGYGEAKSPLVIDHSMAEIFVTYVRRGFPQSLDTMPAAGTTAPATSAGALTLGIAESLGGLILGYAIDPEALISIDVCPTLSDMSTMIYPYAGADRIPLIAAGCQMISEFYGRPSGCHGGKTDACWPGAQAGAEKALSILFPVLAGATGVGTLGHLENAVTFSPVQLVIDDEIAGYVQRMLRGFDVSAETLALDAIREVGIGGNYLTHESTARLFRREFWIPQVFERMPWDLWNAQEVKGAEERAAARAREILATHHPRPLDDYQIREVDRIVAAARADPAYQ